MVEHFESLGNILVDFLFNGFQFSGIYGDSGRIVGCVFYPAWERFEGAICRPWDYHSGVYIGIHGVAPDD